MKKAEYKNVTVSGLPGAGSSTLAKAIAKEMGWKYFSGGDFMRGYAIKKGLFDKNSKLHHDATVYDDEFDRQVDYEVRRAAESESGKVMDAWLSGFMTQGIDSTLHVLVFCSEDSVRVDRIVNRDDVHIDEAKKHIFEREEKNRKKWQRVYAKEWKEWVVDPGTMRASEKIDFWDPKLYDLCIDTFSHSREETLELVMKELSA